MKHRKCHVTDKWRQFACACARARARVCVCVCGGGGCVNGYVVVIFGTTY